LILAVIPPKEVIMRRMILPLMLLAAVACQPATMELTEEDVAAIRALAPAMDEANLANDRHAFAALFAEDCILMVPNAAAIEGRADLLAMMESLPVPEYSEYVTAFLDVDGYGDVAYVRGTYSETYTVWGIAEPVSDTGKSLAVVRKQGDGSWLISVAAWNSDLPLPSMEGEHAEGQEHM
jgi:uncharacterized protein (TIGR02246 family)